MLSHGHGPLSCKAELTPGLLLKGAGGEGWGGLALCLLLVHLGDGVGGAVEGVGDYFAGSFIRYGDLAALALKVVEKSSEGRFLCGLFLLELSFYRPVFSRNESSNFGFAVGDHA